MAVSLQSVMDAFLVANPEAKAAFENARKVAEDAQITKEKAKEELKAANLLAEQAQRDAQAPLNNLIKKYINKMVASQEYADAVAGVKAYLETLGLTVEGRTCSVTLSMEKLDSFGIGMPRAATAAKVATTGNGKGRGPQTPFIHPKTGVEYPSAKAALVGTEKEGKPMSRIAINAYLSK